MMTTGKCSPQGDRGEASAVSPPEAFAFPVSPGQERIWFLEQFQPDTPLFNIPIAIRIQGHLDTPLLEQVLHQIIRRHEILRTRVDLQNYKPVQVVASELPLKMAVVDLTGLPPAHRETEALRLATDEAQRPFNLKSPPLLRVKLVRLAPVDHVFVLTVHQIVFDAWSLAIFFRELASLYERGRTGQPADLSGPAIQYADFAVWQRDRLRTLARELAWWKRHLGGRLPVLELPTDRPRPQVQSYRGAIESLLLPAALQEPLEELRQREDATRFMALLAAFQTLLHRYSGQEQILLGSPVAGRNLKETEDVIGPFANTVVLCADLSGNPTFRELLGRTREAAVNAYAHQEAPFESVIEELQPERNLAHAPVVQAMFALERAPLESLDWPRLKLTPLTVHSGATRFDLTLRLIEHSSGLTARMEYNSDLFDPSTIQGMLAHFRVLLEEIAADPGRRLSNLPLLTETERHQLFADWNRIETAPQRDQPLHALFEAQAARSPEAVAVVSGDRQLTYRKLDEDANRVAHHLKKLGVQPETLVAVCLERAPEMLVGLLGILKAGGAFVPLDPAYPKERLDCMLEDSRVPIVLTQRKLLEFLPRRGRRCVCLDAEWKLLARESAEQPDVTLSPGNLAYVIYTSGSAGKPNGVQIPHRAAVNFLHSMRREPGLSAEDSVLAINPLSFDMALLELFLPLAAGARVVLSTREEVADSAQLAAKIAGAGITVLQATPATWRLLLDSGWRCDRGLRLFSGGEALSRDLANQLLEHGAELWSLYGTTETTVWSAAARIEPGPGPVVVGRPIANTEFYVLDRHLQPLPVGVPGELVIGGDGLARGYLDRPELTAEKFIRHPFKDDPTARVYRTGDRARWLPDGNMEWLGRMDHQVKIRGFRIEPGEIEAVLLQFPKVREAVVIAHEDSPGDKRLVAYLTTYRHTTVSINELRRVLRQTLAEPMVPSAFVMLDQLPLTPSGTVDRAALPAPETDRPPPDTAFLAPRAGLEQAIASIWEAVLSIRNPGGNDNFFDLGGHSLQAVEVQHRLLEQLAIHVPILRLFEYPTIRSLAGHLGERKDRDESFTKKILERTRKQRAAALGPKPFAARARL